MQKLKQELFKRHGIEIDKLKSFGPRAKNSIVNEGSNKIINGRDYHLHDAILLKFCTARFWDFEKIIPDIIYHLEWRQTNIPIPYLTDRTLTVLNKGMLYIHGRCMDYTPIMIIDFGRLKEMLDNNEIDWHEFCNLHNFLAEYIMHNMLVPG